MRNNLLQLMTEEELETFEQMSNEEKQEYLNDFQHVANGARNIYNSNNVGTNLQWYMFWNAICGMFSILSMIFNKHKK